MCTFSGNKGNLRKFDVNRFYQYNLIKFKKYYLGHERKIISGVFYLFKNMNIIKAFVKTVEDDGIIEAIASNNRG